jgi:peptidoglycan/LPS O-acetylase OafA/YrhL
MITAAVSPPEQMMADQGPRLAARRRPGVVDQRPRAGAAGARLAAAIGLGLVSIAGSVVLVAADGIGGGVRWSHHAGASTAPLLLVAGAITALAVAHPVTTRRVLMRVLAVLGFTAWGLAQLFPDSAAAGALNDAAILLFVVDAACLVISDARTLQASARRSATLTRPGASGHAGPGQPGQQLAAAGQAAVPSNAGRRRWLR